MTRTLFCTLLLLSVPEVRAQGEVPPAVFAVVVGNNDSPRPEDGQLKYADDDAARFFEIFSAVGKQATLLSVLDTDTQALFGDAVAASRPPTRANLESALADTFAAVREANGAGRETIFYFVFSGHGRAGSGNEGEIYLLDSSLRRSELYRRVIAASPADFNHVIIDACDAYFMVYRRGEGIEPSEADYREAFAGYLEQETLRRYPNTGVLVATSGDADVHEWSEVAGGVFGHEVRSGILGGADADDDGAVSYAEIQSFITAANRRVDNPRARVAVRAQAPRSNLREPLFRPRDLQEAAFLRFDVDAAGRYWLEDARGVRYADLHPAPDLPVRVALLPSRGGYFLRRGTDEAGLHADPGAAVAVTDLQFVPRAQEARGAVEDALRRGLFAQPFSSGFFAATSELSVVAPPPTLSVTDPGAPTALLYGGVGTSALAFATMGYAAWRAASARNEAQRIRNDSQNHTFAEFRRADQSADRHRTLAWVAGGVGTAVAAATAWLWLAEPGEGSTAWMLPAGRGLSLGVAHSW